MPDVKIEPLGDGSNTYLVSMPGCTEDDIENKPDRQPKSEGQYACEQCSERFISNSVLSRHLKEAHMTWIKHLCLKCNKTFPSEKQVNKHLVSHTEDHFFECSLCGETGKTNKAMEYHRKKEHEGKAWFIFEQGNMQLAVHLWQP